MMIMSHSRPSRLVVFFALLLFLSVSLHRVSADGDHDGDDGHDHHHGHAGAESCACHGDELGITIDCDNVTAITQAYADWTTLGCGDSNCQTDGCEEAYFTVQAHHDYCWDGTLPQNIDINYHVLEEACGDLNCHILRKPDPTKPNCPEPICSDGQSGAGNSAYLKLVEQECQTDCGAGDCPEHYRRLRAEHDDCDGNKLSQNAEQGLHAFEQACEAQMCNVWHPGDPDPLVCVEDETSGAVAIGTVLGVVPRSMMFLIAAGMALAHL